MNKVILMGRLTKDPEVYYSKSETPIAVAKYRLAVRNYYGKNSKEDTVFIDVVAFGNHGEFASKYFSKGRMVIIEGRLHESNWEDAEHNRHWKFEVIAENQNFAEGYSRPNHNDTKYDEDIDPVESEIAIAKLGDEKMSVDDLPF